MVNGEKRLQLSIVIPTLNAGRVIKSPLQTLTLIFSSIQPEIIVSDGGSSDETIAIAEEIGTAIVTGEKGRGGQLKRGAQKATGDWLLFLHADTNLDENALLAIKQFIQNDENKQRIGYFRFKLDSQTDDARKLERKIAWRCNTFALPYGDQGFLISREFYHELGGFRPYPLMEDVDLIWRIDRKHGKSAILPLDADAITSAHKFERDGYFRRSAKNLFCLFLFWIKVPPSLITKIY